MFAGCSPADNHGLCDLHQHKRGRKPLQNKLVYSVNEAAAALGIGRTKLYEMVNAGELFAVKLGKRTLIRCADVDALLDRNLERGMGQ
jgi:excisionase family DNA binding protein